MRELQRRLRLARRYLASPADVLLLARMAAWAVALPVLKRVIPLQRLVSLAASPPRAGGDPDRVADLARVLYRSSAAVVRDNCLERSLVVFRYLGRVDARPELVVGMGKDGRNLLGHVWVTVDGEPLYDAPEKLAEFVPMVVFNASGDVLRKN